MVGKYTDQKIADLQNRASELEWRMEQVENAINSITFRLNKLDGIANVPK